MNVKFQRLIVLSSIPLIASSCGRDRETAEVQVETPPPAAEAPAPTLSSSETGEMAAMQTLDSHLVKARADIGTDAAGSAGELRQAAGIVREESGRTTGEGRIQLERSARILDELARDVDQRAIRSEAEIDREYVHVHSDLARDYHRRAQEAWGRKAIEEAGRDMTAAANHLEQSLKYAGRETDTGAMTVARDTRALGEKMRQGGTWTADEVGRGFEALGGEIERLGREIEPSRYDVARSTGQ